MQSAESKSTLKTLLLRLVQKGAVEAQKIPPSYRYSPLISQEEYIAGCSKSFLERVFDGSAQKLLLNFVQPETINKTDLQQLLDLIEED